MQQEGVSTVRSELSVKTWRTKSYEEQCILRLSSRCKESWLGSRKRDTIYIENNVQAFDDHGSQTSFGRFLIVDFKSLLQTEF